MLQQANNNLDRARTLFGKGWITKAQLDDAVAQHDRNQAAVAEKGASMQQSCPAVPT